MVRRIAALLGLSAALGAYYLWSESLPDISTWGDVAVLGLLVIPAVFALVYLALPLRRARHLLLWGAGVGLLAAALEILELEVLANFAKLAAVTLLAFWFLSYFETAAWVVVVALAIPWVDAISVWRGPTKHIVERQPELFTTFSFAFPVPGEASSAQLGLPDLMFFALFLGAADRWGLRTKLTWAAMALSFGTTLALTVAFDLRGLPALPLLALGFLMPNADLLWRRLRAENAWGTVSSERSDAAGP
jgi:hypothetical protein